MDTHRAKCRVLTRLCNDLRLAIRGDMERLSFKLSGESLISREARDSKDAGAMVSQVEYRLHGDERVWDTLIAVLESCDKKALTDQFWKELRRETAQGVVPVERSSTRKFELAGSHLVHYSDFQHSGIMLLR